MLEKLIAALRSAGQEPTWEQVADAVWLAAHLAAPAAAMVNPSLPPSPAVASGDDKPRAVPHEERQAQEERKDEHKKGEDISLPPEPLPVSVEPAPEPSSADADIALRHVPALDNALELGRALRRLRRRVPAYTRLVLDEEATSQRIADTALTDRTGTHAALWLPVLRPEAERWLRLTLVVDTAPSMLVWRQTIHELRLLLEQLGAFQDVRVWRLESESTAAPLLTGIDGTARHPAQVQDARGRELILVVSDCGSSGWYDGRVKALLDDWGESHPLALIHLLPQRLWRRTGIGASPLVYVRARVMGEANARLRMETRTGVPIERGADTPVPVVTLEPQSLAVWARLLTTAGDSRAPALLWRPQRPPASAGDAKARLRRFRALASPIAVELAGLMAAAPLRPRAMRLVQQVLLPASQQVHLAELILGGLMRPTAPAERNSDPDAVSFEFHAGVRDGLLDLVPIYDAVRAFNLVRRDQAGPGEDPQDFPALVSNPGSAGSALAQSDPQGIAVVCSLLRRLGGDYAAVADQIERPEPVPVPVTPRPGAPKRRAPRAALLIGINEYRDSSLANLPYCLNDVQVMSSLMRNGDYDPDRVTVLAGPKATKDAVLSALQRMADEAKDEDLLILHFSGHGGSANGKPGLLLWDTDPRDLSRTGLMLTDILNMTNAIGAGLVLLLDAGQGSFLKEVEKTVFRDTSRWSLLRRLYVPFSSTRMYSHLPSSDIAVLAACTPEANESSGGLLVPEVLEGNGILAKAVEESVRIWTVRDDIEDVTVEALVHYVSEGCRRDVELFHHPPKWMAKREGLDGTVVFKRSVTTMGETAESNQPRLGEPQSSRFPVWYATNRKPADPQRPAAGYTGVIYNRTIYGTCEILVPPAHRLGSLGSAWYSRLWNWQDDRLKLIVESLQEVDDREFWRDLPPSEQSALVYLHGYNSRFEDTILRAAQLGFDLQFPGRTVCFSWASLGKLSGYVADESRIEASVPVLTAFLERLIQTTGSGKVHVIASGMGCKGLLSAVAKIRSSSSSGVSLGQVILVRPDVDAQVFRVQVLASRGLVQRMTCYAFEADTALRASEQLHGSPRAGQGPPYTFVEGVDLVVISRHSSEGVTGSLGTPAMLRDIYSLLLHATPPESRFGLRRQTALEESYWII